MPTTTEHLRDHLLASLGMPEERPRLPDLDVLRRTEWCRRFERLMRNRLVMGAFRYERLREKRGKPYDFMGRLARLVDQYHEDGNTEHLVNIANYALLEFAVGDHPRRHWHALDDGEHCRTR